MKNLGLVKFKQFKAALNAIKGSYGYDYAYDGIEDFGNGCKMPSGGLCDLDYQNIRIFDDDSFKEFIIEKCAEWVWCLVNNLGVELRSYHENMFVLISDKYQCVYVNSMFDENEHQGWYYASMYNELDCNYEIALTALKMFELVKNKDVTDLEEIIRMYKESQQVNDTKLFREINPKKSKKTCNFDEIIKSKDEF